MKEPRRRREIAIGHVTRLKINGNWTRKGGVGGWGEKLKDDRIRYSNKVLTAASEEMGQVF